MEAAKEGKESKVPKLTKATKSSKGPKGAKGLRVVASKDGQRQRLTTTVSLFSPFHSILLHPTQKTATWLWVNCSHAWSNTRRASSEIMEPLYRGRYTKKIPQKVFFSFSKQLSPRVSFVGFVDGPTQRSVQIEHTAKNLSSALVQNTANVFTAKKEEGAKKRHRSVFDKPVSDHKAMKFAHRLP